MIKYIMILSVLIFGGCTIKEPIIQKQQSATILLKTPTMKFYDKGFITQLDNGGVKLQVYSAGALVLNLDVYEDRICKSTFKCEKLSTFNKDNLSSEYADDFLYKLLTQEDKEINFKDTKNKITIKVIKD